MTSESVDLDVCMEIFRRASRPVPMHRKFLGLAIKSPFWKTAEFQALAKEFGIEEFEVILIKEGHSYAGEGVFLYHLTIQRIGADPIHVEIHNKIIYEFGSVF